MADKAPSLENVTAHDLLTYVDQLSKGMLGDDLMTAIGAVQDAIAGKAQEISKSSFDIAETFLDKKVVDEAKARISAGAKSIAETISNYNSLLKGALAKSVLAYNRSGNINELLFGVNGGVKVEPIQVNVAAPKTQANTPAPAARGEQEDKTFQRTGFVIVGGFGEKALKQIKTIMGGNRGGLPGNTSKSSNDKNEGGSFFPKLNWLTALAGVGLLLDALFSSDKWRNVKKMIGEFILRGRTILTGIKDTFTLILDGAFKGVKAVMTAVKDGALKLIEKSWNGVKGLFKGIIDVVLHPVTFLKNIFGTIKSVFMAPVNSMKGLWNMLKGVGKAIMHPIDSIKGLFSGIKGLFSGGSALAKLNPKSILTMLKGGFKALFKGGSKVALTKIPILGALIGVGFGIKRWADGDHVGGALEIFGGLGNLFPGVGTVLSLAVDALLIWRDNKMGGIEGLKKGNKDPFKQIWEDVQDYLWNCGFMQGMRKIGGGIYELTQGNWVKGFKMIGSGLVDSSPIAWVLSLFEDKFDPATGETMSPAKKFARSDFAKAVSNTVFGWLPDYLKSAFEIGADGSISIKSPEDVAKALLPDWYIGKDGAYDKIKNSTSWAKDKVSGFADNIQNSWNQVFDSANDLVVPSGGKPIKLHKEDSIVAAKPGGPIDKLLAPTRPEAQSQVSNNNLERYIKDLMQEVKNLSKVIEKTIGTQTDKLTQLEINGVSAISQQLQGLASATMQAATAGANTQAPTTVSQGPTRDPAYLVRQRAHSILNPSRRIVGG